MSGKSTQTKSMTSSAPFNPQNVLEWFKDRDFLNHIINEKNIPITKEFINGMFKKYDFDYKVKNIEKFRSAMVHISYIKRTVLTEKTAKLLKEVIPISDADKKKAMELKDEHYNRLELLGDAFIHCILAEYLFARYPNASEGLLTRIRSKLECCDTFATLSKKLGLPKYAVVARNIEQSNGRELNLHLCEDIFESFMGALSLEATYEQCRKFFINVIEYEIDIAELIHINDNYKDRLMQAFHQKKWSDPKYIEDISLQKNIKQGCQEIRSFTVNIKDPNGKIIGTGVGDSKPRAEQQAAYMALVKLRVISEDTDDSSDYYGEESSASDNGSDYFGEDSNGSDYYD